MPENRLYYGDNLEVLQEEIDDESVDLVYLDPPFNSNRSYNVLFENKEGEEAQAQIEAFDDTWTWTPEVDAEYKRLIRGAVPLNVSDAIEAMYRLLGPSDVLSYLVMMTPRLVELHRVLKPTGSLYLHCDPTASHYLKVLLDAVFAPRNFVNEIIWHYHTGGASKSHFSRKHDVLLFYAKDDNKRKFNTQRQPYREENTQHFTEVDEDGRRYRVRKIGGKEYTYYLDEGRIAHDVWEISSLNANAAERMGYPTQKPEALLERIIEASSDEGDVILDPFCGCGTAVVVAHRLRRNWIGIDVTFLAVDLIRDRLYQNLGAEQHADYETGGIPRDFGGAQALFKRDPFEFERWAVSLVDGQPNEKQVGDRGVDGRVRFPLGDKNDEGRLLVSVKGGKNLAPAMVLELAGAVENHGAEMGILLTLEEPTRGMVEAANRAGTYTHPVTKRTYPRVQVVTVEELLDGERPDMPDAISPYMKGKYRGMAQQTSMQV